METGARPELWKRLCYKKSVEGIEKVNIFYRSLKAARKAVFRDIVSLIHLGAISYTESEGSRITLYVRLEWATEITETTFFQQLSDLENRKHISFCLKHDDSHSRDCRYLSLIRDSLPVF